MDEKTIHRGKCLLAYLRQSGQDDFGSVIYWHEVCRVLDLEYPEKASKAVFDALEMIELNAVGYVREVLLKEGKYLGKSCSGYRILLPNENASQVARYRSSADRKLSRALKLVRNTPRGDAMPDRDHTEARLAMKRDAVRDRSVFGAV